jgi:predicted nucleic acid-binding protein
MQKVIISDTSCLIQFDLIGELELLNKLFGSITITPEKPYLAKMKSTGFRLSIELEQNILQKAGEQ